ncbi:hypothetical protein Mhypo_02679 [Meiothermus hypogaeus]|uniref:Uncharacterized protein n=1 Tax=Meiothermus hypogaeus TaxID=884155 RepID=A0ABX9MLH9_9DEIN|nr:hypothetical protein Mhypo_02679 [Meiothermus hypogaeus]
MDQLTNPAFAIAEIAGDLGDGLTFGQQPEGLPASAFDGVLGLAIEGMEVIRMVPQLQFQARAALVFGELHDTILID